MSGSSAIKKKGTIRVRQYQLKIIVEAMEANPFLNGHQMSELYSNEKRKADWEELCQQLNSVGGAVKTVSGWQKCWSDQKVEVKKRRKAAAEKAGGRRNDSAKLSSLEERIFRFVGSSHIVEMLDDAEAAWLFEDENGISDEDDSDKMLDKPQRTGESSVLLAKDMSSATPLKNQVYSVPDDSSPHQPEMNEKHQRQRSPCQNTPQRQEIRLQQKTKTNNQVLKHENTPKLVEGQAQIASALKRCAEAMERRNDIQERLLAIENKKADAFIGILNLLNEKL